MQYAIDTNVVFGIINEVDRLSPVSERLIRNISGKVVVLPAVVRETCRKFPKKVYNAIEPVLEFYRSVELVISEAELEKLEEEKLNELINAHPRMNNFYKLAFDVAKKARKENGLEGVIFGLMDYYAEINDCDRLMELFGEKISELNPELEFTAGPLRYRDVDEFLSTLRLVKNVTAGVRFKDDNDRDIFYDFVLNFEGEKAVFISDDGEFVKKARRALKSLDGHLNVEGLIFKRIDEILRDKAKN
jgi:predicted nucleic acid-binding protein